MGPLGNLDRGRASKKRISDIYFHLVLLHPLSCPSYFYRARPPFSSLGHQEPRCGDHSERQDPSPWDRDSWREVEIVVKCV